MLTEILFASSPDASNITALDSRTGAILESYNLESKEKTLISLPKQCHAIYNSIHLTFTSEKSIIYSTTKQKLICPEIISSLCYANGFIYAGSEQGRIFVWNIHDGSLVSCVQGHLSKINKILVSGWWVVTAGQDTLVKIWNNDSLLFTMHEHVMAAMDVQAMGNWFISCSLDQTVQIFDKTQRLHSVLFNDPLVVVCPCADEQSFYVGSINGKVYRATVQTRVQSQFLVQRSCTITGLVLSIDQSILFISGIDGIALMDTVSNNITRVFQMPCVCLTVSLKPIENYQPLLPLLKRAKTPIDRVMIQSDHSIAPEIKYSPESLGQDYERLNHLFHRLLAAHEKLLSIK